MDLRDAYGNAHRLWKLRERLRRHRSPVAKARYLTSTLRTMRREVARERAEAPELERLLELARGRHDVCWAAADEPTPLVTILIPTYRIGARIASGAIASALRQTHERIEVLVVGDECDDATAQAVRSVRDDRVRFVNLGARGTYPEDPEDRWMVAGSVPVTVGQWLARGAWIAPCDDDDELTDDHVEVLLRAARAQRVEMIYSQARMEMRPGEWEVVGREPLRFGRISHGSVLFAAELRLFGMSNTSWKLLEPTDWNLWRRMQQAGVRIGYLPEITYVHRVETLRR